MWLDVRWNMKTSYSTFHPGLNYRKLHKASGNKKKKSQNENSCVPRTAQTALSWECVLTKETQILAGGFMEWVLYSNSPRVGQRQWPEGQPAVGCPCQCVMERATGLKKLSDVKISSVKFVISVTSNTVQQPGNKEKPTLARHLSSEKNQVFPKIH